MEKFTNLILLMNVDSSKNLFLIIGLLSLIAIIAVLFIKKKKKIILTRYLTALIMYGVQFFERYFYRTLFI